VLTDQDLMLLSQMIKVHLEALVIKRTRKMNNLDLNVLNEEIENLYSLLSKVLISAELNKETFSRSKKDIALAKEFNKDIRSQQDLAYKLIGTCWRKNNGANVILFRDTSTFDSCRMSTGKWSTHEYILDDELGTMTLHWKMDNFRASCQFNNTFTQFEEEKLGPNYIWRLEWFP